MIFIVSVRSIPYWFEPVPNPGTCNVHPVIEICYWLLLNPAVYKVLRCTFHVLPFQRTLKYFVLSQHRPLIAAVSAMRKLRQWGILGLLNELACTKCISRDAGAISRQNDVIYHLMTSFITWWHHQYFLCSSSFDLCDHWSWGNQLAIVSGVERGHHCLIANHLMVINVRRMWGGTLWRQKGWMILGMVISIRIAVWRSLEHLMLQVRK